MRFKRNDDLWESRKDASMYMDFDLCYGCFYALEGNDLPESCPQEEVAHSAVPVPSDNKAKEEETLVKYPWCKGSLVLHESMHKLSCNRDSIDGKLCNCRTNHTMTCRNYETSKNPNCYEFDLCTECFNCLLNELEGLTVDELKHTGREESTVVNDFGIWDCPFSNQDCFRDKYEGNLKVDLKELLPVCHSTMNGHLRKNFPVISGSLEMALWKRIFFDQALQLRVSRILSYLASTYKPIASDGLCFFRSLLQALRLDSSTNDIVKLRKCLVIKLQEKSKKLSKWNHYFNEEQDWQKRKAGEFKKGNIRLFKRVEGESFFIDVDGGWGSQYILAFMLQVAMVDTSKTYIIVDDACGSVPTALSLIPDLKCRVVGFVEDRAHTTTCLLCQVVALMVLRDEVDRAVFLRYNGTNHYDTFHFNSQDLLTHVSPSRYKFCIVERPYKEPDEVVSVDSSPDKPKRRRIADKGLKDKITSYFVIE